MAEDKPQEKQQDDNLKLPDLSPFIKLYKGMQDVESYLRWIYATRLHEVKSVDNNVIDVFFEDLVLNFDRFKEKLLNQLSIDAEIPSSYQPSISAKNVKMYKNILSNREIDALRKIDHT